MIDGSHLTPAPAGNAATYIGQAWLVIVLCLVIGSGLAALEIWLKPLIRRNQDDEALGQAAKLVPGAVRGEFCQLELGDGSHQRVVRALDGKGALLGWLVEASGQGFVDRIGILIAVDPAGERMLGIAVIQQNETPALGNRIRDAEFREQFRHTEGHPMVVGTPVTVDRATAGPNRIKALTAATISSVAICNIVNQTLTPALVAAFRAAPGGAAVATAPGAGHGE